MPAVIISTCGTSLLSGGAIDNDLRKLLSSHANAGDWNELPEDVSHTLKQHCISRETELLAGDESLARRMSAELNSLLSWHKEYNGTKQDTYILLATDTVLGRQTAESVEKWLQARGHTTQIMSESGLRTRNLTEFRESLSGLSRKLIDMLNGYKQAGYEIYFNLTGGFKGLNGFIQALSTLYADKTFYLFERSEELLFIPKLPFQLNAQQLVNEHLHAFRRLSLSLECKPAQLASIPDSLLFQIEEHITLSEWGELIWQQGHKGIYQQGLLPSISAQVRYDEGFAASTKDLTPALLSIVNQRISALGAYAEGGCKNALSSLDPKPLQHQIYKKRNLWECDLDNHHRIFMVKDGNNFLLEKVGKALH